MHGRRGRDGNGWYLPVWMKSKMYERMGYKDLGISASVCGAKNGTIWSTCLDFRNERTCLNKGKFWAIIIKNGMGNRVSCRGKNISILRDLTVCQSVSEALTKQGLTFEYRILNLEIKEAKQIYQSDAEDFPGDSCPFEKTARDRGYSQVHRKYLHGL